MAKVNQKDTIDYDSIVVREPSVFERMWQYRYFYLMFIPVALVLFIFFYWPMLGVRYAFSTYKLKQITLRLEPDYSTGLGNFKRLFGADPFIGALRNTLVLSIVNLILATVLTVVIALLLNELQHQWSKKIVQTVLYLPHFLSWVVAASIFMLILSAGTDATGQDTANMGFINALLCKVGILDKPIDFLTESKCWRSVWYIMNRWKETGWGTIIFLAALAGVDVEQYEAAIVDGASRFQQLIYITLPAIMGTVVTMFILRMGSVLDTGFEQIILMQNDLNRITSETFDTYVYQ